MEKIVPNVRLMCKNVKLDERTEEYIYKRIEKLNQFNGKVLEFEVEICMDKKGKFRAELMVRTPYKLYRTEETTESIEGSIDIAVDEMKNQLVKDKDKMKELRERGARSIKKKTVIAEEARF
ncbi:MAG: ribosome-associated translation inhibitor RaiA [Parcubacteria group bacterium]|jgi:ribosomal subunit interface protein